MVARLAHESPRQRPAAPAPSTRATITVPRARLPIAPAIVARATRRSRSDRRPLSCEARGRLPGDGPHVPRDEAPATRRRIEARSRRYRPPGSSRPVPITPVERVSAHAARAPWGFCRDLSVLARGSVESGPTPTQGDMYPSDYVDYEDSPRAESQVGRGLGAASNLRLPDFYADLWRSRRRQRIPRARQRAKPPGMQLDPLDELEQ